MKGNIISFKGYLSGEDAAHEFETTFTGILIPQLNNLYIHLTDRGWTATTLTLTDYTVHGEVDVPGNIINIAMSLATQARLLNQHSTALYSLVDSKLH